MEEINNPDVGYVTRGHQENPEGSEVMFEFSDNLGNKVNMCFDDVAELYMIGALFGSAADDLGEAQEFGIDFVASRVGTEQSDIIDASTLDLDNLEEALNLENTLQLDEGDEL